MSLYKFSLHSRRIIRYYDDRVIQARFKRHSSTFDRACWEKRANPTLARGAKIPRWKTESPRWPVDSHRWSGLSMGSPSFVWGRDSTVRQALFTMPNMYSPRFADCHLFPVRYPPLPNTFPRVVSFLSPISNSNGGNHQPRNSTPWESEGHRVALKLTFPSYHRWWCRRIRTRWNAKGRGDEGKGKTWSWRCESRAPAELIRSGLNREEEKLERRMGKEGAA